jgi:predicted aminopeptidase
LPFVAAAIDSHLLTVTETMEQIFLARCIKLGYFNMLQSSHMRRMMALLAANIKERQQRHTKFKEHRRNNIWRDYLIKARTVNGYFMRRHKMPETTFYRLVHEIKSKNRTAGVDMICPHVIVAFRLNCQRMMNYSAALLSVIANAGDTLQLVLLLGR